MFSKRSVETPRLIMITTYTNMTYHEYQCMFDIALFLKKLSKGEVIRVTNRCNLQRNIVALQVEKR